MGVRFTPAAVVGLALLMTGCGSSDPGARITATLETAGKPYAVRGDEELFLSLVPKTDSADLRGGNAQYDHGRNVFLVPEALAPGEYKIVLECTDAKYQDRFKGAFSEEHTPLHYTVTTDKEQAIVIDLG